LSLARIGFFTGGFQRIFTSLKQFVKIKSTVMKKLLTPAFIQLSQTELINLTKEVKETIFLDQVKATDKKSFTSPELWKIQHLKRPVVIRRGFSL